MEQILYNLLRYGCLYLNKTGSPRADVSLVVGG